MDKNMDLWAESLTEEKNKCEETVFKNEHAIGVWKQRIEILEETLERMEMMEVNIDILNNEFIQKAEHKIDIMEQENEKCKEKISTIRHILRTINGR